MSQPGTTDRLQTSHDIRTFYKQLVYCAMLAIVILAALILCFGIVYPPPAPNTNAADWGAAIVARSAAAVPVLLTLLAALTGFLGISEMRGAHDAKLDVGP